MSDRMMRRRSLVYVLPDVAGQGAGKGTGQCVRRGHLGPEKEKNDTTGTAKRGTWHVPTKLEAQDVRGNNGRYTRLRSRFLLAYRYLILDPVVGGRSVA